MKLNPLLVLFLLWPLLAGAQANYKKGLIVTEQGDTLKGYINDLDWTKNPKRISYKETQVGSEDMVFDHNNLLFFQIDGEDSYQRFTVSVSMDEITLSKLHIGVDTSKVVKSVFLKVLVDGCNVNLYSYTDEIKTRYYCWDKSKESPFELIYKLFYYKPLNSGNDMQKLVTLNNYIGQLNSIASQFGMNSKELQRKIKVAPYLKNQLAEIIVMINGNNATNMCLTSQSYEKLKLSFFASINLRRSILNSMKAGSPFATLGSNDVTTQSDHKAFWFPSVGYGFDLALKSGSRLYIREELNFSIDKLSSADKYKEPNNYYYEDYKLSFKQWNLTLSSGMNYNIFNSYDLKAYLGIGFNLNYSKVISSEHYSHGYELYRDYMHRGDLLNGHEYWISVPFKAGIIVKSKFEIKYIFQSQRLIINNRIVPRNIGTMEFGIGYFFN